MPTFSECSADEICSSFIAAAGPIDVRARLVDIRVERVENVGKNRNGRARGVDVRKGKLLAGDSGRKIAEVIDLRRAIYQRGSREDGRGTLASVVREYSHVHIRIHVCVWISGKGKRGRVFVRFAKCTSQRNENEDIEELKGREG